MEEKIGGERRKKKKKAKEMGRRLHQNHMNAWTDVVTQRRKEQRHSKEKACMDDTERMRESRKKKNGIRGIIDMCGKKTCTIKDACRG